MKFLAEKYGIERLGFLTLTFADHVLDAREAQRRFNNLNRRVLGRYVDHVRVLERQKSKRIHYHLLVVLADDIRSGVKWDEFEKGVYRSANDRLRSEWSFWRKTARNYGFGRTELLPIRSTAEAIGKYVGKYISKHIEQREESDKGVRLVAYSKGAGRCNVKFSWASPGAKNYRRKLEWLAVRLGYTAQTFQQDFQRDYGPKWGFLLGLVVQSIKFSEYDTRGEAVSDWSCCEDLPLDIINIKLGGSYVEKARQSQADALLVAFDLRKRNQKKLGAGIVSAPPALPGIALGMQSTGSPVFAKEHTTRPRGQLEATPHNRVGLGGVGLEVRDNYSASVDLFADLEPLSVAPVLDTLSSVVANFKSDGCDG